MLTLVGIVIVVIGFVLRINPLLVVTIAGLATGIASGLGPLAVVAAFGKAFITSRYVAIVWLVLPVIGLLEHAGLKERARAVVAGLRAATAPRVLLVYFTIRQITSALGLTSLGGHAQMVRPRVPCPLRRHVGEHHVRAVIAQQRSQVRGCLHLAGMRPCLVNALVEGSISSFQRVTA